MEASPVAEELSVVDLLILRLDALSTELKEVYERQAGYSKNIKLIKDLLERNQALKTTTEQHLKTLMDAPIISLKEYRALSGAYTTSKAAMANLQSRFKETADNLRETAATIAHLSTQIEQTETELDQAEQAIRDLDTKKVINLNEFRRSQS